MLSKNIRNLILSEHRLTHVRTTYGFTSRYGTTDAIMFTRRYGEKRILTIGLVLQNDRSEKNTILNAMMQSQLYNHTYAVLSNSDLTGKTSFLTLADELGVGVVIGGREHPKIIVRSKRNENPRGFPVIVGRKFFLLVSYI